jgi:ceramide glucosyltransferase
MADFYQLISWTAYICLAGATFGCLYMTFACVRVLRFGRGDGGAHKPVPVPVTVLLPLCGHEPALYARLRALCEQDYAASVQILCAIHDPEDPAIAAVEKVAADCPDATLEWQVDPGMHGRNLKISNLMNVMDRVRHEVLVMIDDDIVVGRHYLSHVVGELQQPNVGAVTCLYYGVPNGALWTKLSAMATNLQFLPSVIVGLSTGLAQPCFGSTIAITKQMLEQIGGLASFVDFLWDDYAIGQAVRETGKQVAVSSLTVGHVCAEDTGRDFFHYQLRFARTIASIDPVGYIGSVVIHPFALALLAISLGSGDAGLALAGTALASRFALAYCMQRRFGMRMNYWLIPVHDLAAFAVYVTSFFGGTVMWRGQRHRVHSDGTLLQTSQ